MPSDNEFSFVGLRKALGLGQSEMAERMGLSLRPYQELESATRRVRPRHIRLAESVALDIAIERQNPDLVPDKVRRKVIQLAMMVVQQNLQEKTLSIAKSILGQNDE